MMIGVCILVCCAALALLIAMLRRDRISLGLPLAYLFGLLLIHLPGGMAHLIGAAALRDSDLTELGLSYATIGVVCFVIGVGISRLRSIDFHGCRDANRQKFSMFCVGGGWFLLYGVGSLTEVPSIGAAIEGGAAAWMLGVMLGLRAATLETRPASAALWLGALAVYPILMLLFGGFVSYGSAAIIVVLSVLAVSIKSHTRVFAGVLLAAVLGLNVFLNYFEHRDAIRGAVWGGASLEERVDASLDVFREFRWFDPSDDRHLAALDRRLNQNYFVGLAAVRLQNGEIDYLHGRSLWEGLLALVPRILWPEKPVAAGSGSIVAEMTGLVLSETTSFGVGNVMEFQINFGTPGVMAGFLVLGWLLGFLDRRAAVAEATGHLGRVFLYFLPAVSLIRPNGSLVELAAGPASAWLAALAWQYVWNFWSSRCSSDLHVPATVAAPHA